MVGLLSVEDFELNLAMVPRGYGVDDNAKRLSGVALPITRPRSSYRIEASLVVNDDLQILHFRGDTSPYLKPIPGKATLFRRRPTAASS